MASSYSSDSTNKGQKPHSKRLTLLERQQALLEEKGFSKRTTPTTKRTNPSLHPAITTASAVATSAAPATTTAAASVGAGDETQYWDYQHRRVERKDLGHKCRECKQPFATLGAPLSERRGARISQRYHAQCFSGFADPRSQAQSSAHTGRLAGTQLAAAPRAKAAHKMRTASHFVGGSSSTYHSSSGASSSFTSGRRRQQSRLK